MSSRLQLTRADGQVYLDRWGFSPRGGRFGGIFLHRMDAPDPGRDLHDHPWTFVTLVLRGGYVEERAQTREAPWLALAHEAGSPYAGFVERRRVGSARRWRLDECHRVTEIRGRRSWSLVIHGPKRRRWGFYLPTGWMLWEEYERTVRAERGELRATISNAKEGR